MYNFEDMLRSGATPESIMEELAKELAAATHTIEAEKATKEKNADKLKTQAAEALGKYWQEIGMYPAEMPMNEIIPAIIDAFECLEPMIATVMGPMISKIYAATPKDEELNTAEIIEDDGTEVKISEHEITGPDGRPFGYTKVEVKGDKDIDPDEVIKRFLESLH